jgi:hypothetical protein
LRPSGNLLSQALGGQESRFDNGLVPGTSTDIAGDAFANFRLAGSLVRGKQLGQRHQHARNTKAALKGMRLPKRLLQGRQRAVGRGQTLDGPDFPTMRLHCQQQARSARAPFDENRAGSTYAVLTADVRTGEADLVSQEVGQREPGLNHALVFPIVDAKLEVSRIRHTFILS